MGRRRRLDANPAAATRLRYHRRGRRGHDNHCRDREQHAETGRTRVPAPALHLELEVDRRRELVGDGVAQLAQAIRELVPRARHASRNPSRSLASPPRQQRLHGSERDVEDAGDVLVRSVVVVAQHDRGALAHRESAQRDEQGVARHDVDGMHDERGQVDGPLVPRHHLLVTEVRLGEVGDGAREVRGERVGLAQRVELGRDPHERLLHQILGQLALTGEHQREPQRRGRVGAIQPVEQHLVADCQWGDRLHDFQTLDPPLRVSHF